MIIGVMKRLENHLRFFVTVSCLVGSVRFTIVTNKATATSGDAISSFAKGLGADKFCCKRICETSFYLQLVDLFKKKWIGF